MLALPLANCLHPPVISLVKAVGLLMMVSVSLREARIKVAAITTDARDDGYFQTVMVLGVLDHHRNN